MTALSLPEHRYICVLDREGWRITLNVFTDRTLSGEELLPLAVEQAIAHAKLLGVTALPDDYAPIGFTYRGLI